MLRVARTTAVAVALAAVSALSVGPSQAATVVTQGLNWQAATRLGVTSISPSRQYTITFASEALRQRYTPYLTAAVAQAQQIGVRLAIGGVEPVDPNKCGPAGHIQYMEMYRPVGTPGWSQGMPCPFPAGGATTGGIVAIDSEYWDGSWPIPQHKLRNTIVHEMLHALGLDHPNRDLNGDGTVSSYECVKDSAGITPVACSPNGGYPDSRAGRLTKADLTGLSVLLRNARVQGIA